MIINMYSVYDGKALVYDAPFCAVNDNVAIRMFTQAVNDGRSNISKFPGDYTLVRVGYYDDSKGILKGEIVPAVIMLAEKLVKSEVKEVK